MRIGLLALAVACTGCFEGRYLTAGPCTRDADCGPELSCEQGVCGGLAGVCEQSEGIVELLPSTVPAVTDQIALSEEPGLDASCSADQTPEAVYHWIAPEEGRYIARAGASLPTWESGVSEPSVHVHTRTCDGEERACGTRGSGTAAFEAAEGEPLVVVVDGIEAPLLDPSSGYRLEIREADFCITEPGNLELGPTNGSTLEQADRLQIPGCAPYWVGDAPETVHRFVAPQGGRFSFDVLDTEIPFDSVLYVLDEHCGGTPLACNDDVIIGGNVRSAVSVDLDAGQEVLVVVDGKGGSDGPYELRADEAFACTEGDFDPQVPIAGSLGTLASSRMPALEGHAVQAYRYHVQGEGALLELTVTPDGDGPAPQVSVHEGSCVGGPVRPPAESGRFVLPNGDYVVAVSSPGSAPVDYTLDSDFLPCPEAVYELKLGEPREVVAGEDDYVTEFSSGHDCLAGMGAEFGEAKLSFEAKEDGTYSFNATVEEGGAIVVRNGGCGPQIACGFENAEVFLQAGQEVLVVVEMPPVGLNRPQPVFVRADRVD